MRGKEGGAAPSPLRGSPPGYFSTDEGQTIRRDHAKDALTRRGGGGFVDVKAHLPVGMLQRPDEVIGAIRGQHHQLAIALEHPGHMARRMAVSRERRNARGRFTAILDESGLRRQRPDFLIKALILLTGPVIKLGPAGDITGARKDRRRPILHGQPANVIAMHMGQHHHIHRLGRNPGLVQRRKDPFRRETGVKEHQLISGIHQHRAEGAAGAIDRQESRLRDRSEVCIADIHGESAFRIGVFTRSRQQGGNLKSSQPESAEQPFPRPLAVNLRRCRGHEPAGQSTGKRQGGCGKKGVAAGQTGHIFLQITGCGFRRGPCPAQSGSSAERPGSTGWPLAQFSGAV